MAVKSYQQAPRYDVNFKPLQAKTAGKTLRVSSEVQTFGTLATRRVATPVRPLTNEQVKKLETEYGTNKYDLAMQVLGQTGSTVSTVSGLLGANSSKEFNATAKTTNSEKILSNINNAENYSQLKAAKAELEVGKTELTADYNGDATEWISQKSTASLAEMGIAVPQLSQISGEFEMYEDDIKAFDQDKVKCQQVSDECNTQLPVISAQAAEKKAEVKSLKSTIINCKWQLAKLTVSGWFSKDKEQINAKKAEIKAELQEAQEKMKTKKAEYEKLKAKEDALKEGVKESAAKMKEIDQKKEELKNYHEAEAKVVDKTFEIAQNNDKKLSAQITKMKQKHQEIQQAAKDVSLAETDSSDSNRNSKLEKLQADYEKIANETSAIYVDLGNLIKDNDENLNVMNSSGAVYNIQHYTEAQKILEEGIKAEGEE